MNVITVKGIEAQNFDHARLLALKKAGYHADPAVAIAGEHGESLVKSEDRKHFNRILRTHIDRDGKYRFNIAR